MQRSYDEQEVMPVRPSLVLGYLNPQSFAGGLDIDVDLSRKVIENQIAEPLGMSLLEAALGIHAIVNSNMAQTLRLVSIKRGHDPRDFVLIPFGGAGPLQGGRLAENASINRILMPPTPERTTPTNNAWRAISCLEHPMSVLPCGSQQWVCLQLDGQSSHMLKTIQPQCR